MLAQVSYIKVGRAEEIRLAGWIRVSILGWDIVVISREKEFIALERGSSFSQNINAFPGEGHGYSRSGAFNMLDKFLNGPSDSAWGKLQYFPVRVENDLVYVGIIG